MLSCELQTNSLHNFHATTYMDTSLAVPSTELICNECLRSDWLWTTVLIWERLHDKQACNGCSVPKVRVPHKANGFLPVCICIWNQRVCSFFKYGHSLPRIYYLAVYMLTHWSPTNKNCVLASQIHCFGPCMN